MTIKKFNSGEWSEFYAFLKILEKRNLPAAAENLEAIPGVFYPVAKIIQNDIDANREYDLTNEKVIRIKIHVNELKTDYDIPYQDVKDDLPTILSAIKKKKNSKGTFALPEADALIEKLNSGKIKKDSKSKEDISLVIRDHITSQETLVGFSIKSYIGGKATLLNASGATIFTFKVTNLNTSLDEINNTSGARKLRKRVELAKELGAEFSYESISSSIFEKNLRKIDSFLPEIISEIMVGFFSSKGSSLSNLTQYIISNKKLKGEILEKFDYEDIKFKLKQLLLASALGMVPNTDWDGKFRADGGYVIIKEDGDLVCYHVYNISELGEYLFNNTKLDTPSTGRSKSALFYNESNNVYYDYSFQIRFN